MDNRNIFNGGISLDENFESEAISPNTEEIATQIAIQSYICSNLSKISLHRLGTGSYGEVYEILDSGRSSGNVIKISTKSCTSSDYNPNYSVAHEAKILQALKGLKNVVQIKDSGQFSTRKGEFDWYIAEKLYSIDNNTINQIFSNPTDNINQVSYSETNILRFAMDLSEALIQIKERLKKNNDRLIHRDIKLENIMYGYDSSGNIVFKLIDFGISKTFSGTNGGTRIGSYNTMAPEQFFEHKYSANERTDVYALCCVLYKLINNDHSYLFSISANDIRHSRIEAPNERLVLNNIYKVDVEEYLEKENHKHTVYPSSEFFSSNLLPFGSRELKQAIMKGLSLNLNDRPSPEEFQLAIFKCLKANGPLLGITVNSFSSYSMYSEFIKSIKNTPQIHKTITAETPKFKEAVNDDANGIVNTDTEKTKAETKRSKSPKTKDSNKTKDHSGLPVFLAVILDAAAAILFSLWPVLFADSYYEHISSFFIVSDYSYPIILFLFILFNVIIVKGMSVLLAYSYFIKKKPVMSQVFSLIIEALLYIPAISILLVYIIALFADYEYFAADICAFTALLAIAFANSITNIIFVHRQRHFKNISSSGSSTTDNGAYRKVIVQHTALCSVISILFICLVAFWQYSICLDLNVNNRKLVNPIYISSTSFFIAFCSILFFALSFICIGRLYKKLNYSLTELTISRELCSDIKTLNKYTSLKKLSVYIPEPAIIVASFKITKKLEALAITNEYGNNAVLSINCIDYLSIYNGLHYGSFEINCNHSAYKNDKGYGFYYQDSPAYFFPLKSLTLNGITLSTILFISFYPNLLNLNLNKCSLERIDDISCKRFNENNLPFSISNLSKLTTLSLADNLITDVEPLSALENLQCVNLSNNKIKKITASWRSLRIKEFYCSNNQLVSICGINNLTILKKIDCSNNSITDISFLNKSRYSLEQVNVGNNPLPKDAVSSAFSGCTKLRELSINSTNTSNLSFVSYCSDLRFFAANFNSITDGTPLSYCRKLETLDLSCNTINDISFLKNLTAIKDLWLACNEITDISALPRVYYTQLNLSDNNIQSFAPLSYLAGDLLVVSYNEQIDFIGNIKYLHQFKRIFFFDVPDDKKVRIEDELGKEKCYFNPKIKAGNPYRFRV